MLNNQSWPSLPGVTWPGMAGVPAAGAPGGWGTLGVALPGGSTAGLNNFPSVAPTVASPSSALGAMSLPAPLGSTGLQAQLPSPAGARSNNQVWDLAGGDPGASNAALNTSLVTSNPQAAATLASVLGAIGNPGKALSSALGMSDATSALAGPLANVGIRGALQATGLDNPIAKITNQGLSSLLGLAGVSTPVGIGQKAASLISAITNNSLASLGSSFAPGFVPPPNDFGLAQAAAKAAPQGVNNDISNVIANQDVNFSPTLATGVNIGPAVGPAVDSPTLSALTGNFNMGLISAINSLTGPMGTTDVSLGVDPSVEADVSGNDATGVTGETGETGDTGDAGVTGEGDAGASAASGDGGGGGGGGGGCHLMNYHLTRGGHSALAVAHSRAILGRLATRALTGNPQMQRLFVAYQQAAQQILAKIEQLDPARRGQAIAQMRESLVVPVLHAAQQGDVLGTARLLRAHTVHLMQQHGLPLPMEALAQSDAVLGPMKGVSNG